MQKLRFKKRYVLWILIISSLIVFILPYDRKDFVNPLSNEADSISKKRFIKDSYERTKISQTEWNKDLIFDYSSSQNFSWINGQNALTVNINSKKVLLEKDSKNRVPIASLTKIMTAVVALEHKNLDDLFKVSEKAASIGENSMGISQNEVYTLEDLVYGLILHSGNDAAFAIAENTAGSVEAFTDWMNFKAEELGLKDTRFFDPSGLDDNTYSTAYDLAKLTTYALKNPDFKKIVGTVEYLIPATEEHKQLTLSNQTNLLRTYPGVQGVKTGFTEAARYSLISYAKNSEEEIVGVVLRSEARKSDMIYLLDASYEKLGIKISHPLLTF